jgi:hypothetical protein
MAAETADLLSHCLIVSLPQLAPSPVAKLRGSAGRVYNVSEHDRRQHAIGFRFAAGSSQKLLDLIGHTIGEIVIIEREMIAIAPNWLGASGAKRTAIHSECGG